MSVLKEIKLRERLAHAYNALATAYEKANEDGIPLGTVSAIDSEIGDRVFTDRANAYALKQAETVEAGEVMEQIGEALAALFTGPQPEKPKATINADTFDEQMTAVAKELEDKFGKGNVRMTRLTPDGQEKVLVGDGDTSFSPDGQPFNGDVLGSILRQFRPNISTEPSK